MAKPAIVTVRAKDPVTGNYKIKIIDNETGKESAYEVEGLAMTSLNKQIDSQGGIYNRGNFFKVVNNFLVSALDPKTMKRIEKKKETEQLGLNLQVEEQLKFAFFNLGK